MKDSKFVNDACRELNFEAVEPEVAASIIRPYFDAVRDEFASFVPMGARESMSLLSEAIFVVEADRHDSPRHFAACRDDGLHLSFAPQLVELPVENMVAILAHEFGHAADFAYPGYWRLQPGCPGVAEWIGDPETTKWGRHWLRTWMDRGRDHVEWTADGIATAVTGRSIGYCGPCALQAFDRGLERPKGLR